MKPRLINLPYGYRTVIDEADWPAVQDLTLYRGSNGYVYFSKWKDGKSTPGTLHGYLMGRHQGMHVDHINGDKLDNRRVNLRVVDPSTNQANRHGRNVNNTSGVRGVSRHSQCDRWVAQITVDGKNRYLGVYKNLDDAVEARRIAERIYFGEECP